MRCLVLGIKQLPWGCTVHSHNTSHYLKMSIGKKRSMNSLPAWAILRGAPSLLTVGKVNIKIIKIELY